MNELSKRKLFDLRTQIPIMQLVLILQNWHYDFRLLTTHNYQVVHARLPSIALQNRTESALNLPRAALSNQHENPQHR